MTQAAGERGADFESLQRKNIELMQDQEKRQQELKMAELEKQDLQKELDTLQSSCNYFQTKYKATQNELRTAQREQAAAVEGLSKARGQLTERQHEVEALRGQVAALSQLMAESRGRRQ